MIQVNIFDISIIERILASSWVHLDLQYVYFCIALKFSHKFGLNYNIWYWKLWSLWAPGTGAILDITWKRPMTDLTNSRYLSTTYIIVEVVCYTLYLCLVLHVYVSTAIMPFLVGRKNSNRTWILIVVFLPVI